MASYKDSTQSNTDNQVEGQLLGRVKWFNNKSGYGFITITDGPQSGVDVFVHHSAIDVENQQYKYLVQGEYVEFKLIKAESSLDKHDRQAFNVSGIRGGKLMCETRHEVKQSRNEHKSGVAEAPLAPKQRLQQTEGFNSLNNIPYVVYCMSDAYRRRHEGQKQRPRHERGEGPRDATKEWSLVGDKGKPVSRKPLRNINGATIAPVQST